MRILVCASEYYPITPSGGIGVSVNNIVNHLRKKGIECDICSPYGPDIYVPLFINQRYGVLSLLNYWHEVSKYCKHNAENYDVVWLHQPLLLACPFENNLATMHVFPSSYAKIIRESNIPPHLKLYYSIREYITRYCLRKLIPSINYFSVVSPHVANDLEKLGIDSMKITYIPNGVDINKFRPRNNKYELRKKYEIPEDAIAFISVGRLTYQKQPLKLIKFFSKLSERLENAILFVVGTGDMIDDVRQIVRRLNLKNVYVLGYVDDEELPLLYACADYFVMSSIYEGQPITLLEAMASGLPAIVSNIPSLKPIIKKSNTGLLIDFSDFTVSVKKTIQFIKKENLQKHSKHSRSFIEDNHSWEEVTYQYIQIFNKIKSTKNN